MTQDAEGFLDEAPPKGLALEGIKALSAGAKVVLVGCALLFFSLFLTWQNLEVDYGRQGTGTQMLDGWDIWGLLLAFLLIGLVSLILIVKASDVEIPLTVAWEQLILVVALVLFGLTLLKNLTDADSAWGSYVALGLAAVVVVGAFLDWASVRSSRSTTLRRRRRRRVKSAA